MGRMDNKNGTIVIPSEVIAKMAGIAATQCYGVVGMASRNTADELASLLKRDSLHKGIKVEIDNEHLTIDLHVIVEYGINISATCENISNNVRYYVETMTGFDVKKVNVYVESIRVDD